MKLAVLWDVDGTLADSEPLHGAALVEALAKFGVAARPEDELLGVDRRRVHAHLQASYPGVPDYAAYCAEVDSYYIANVARAGPVSAAVAACRRFAAEGRRQAAVSNSEPHIVAATLRNIGVHELLDGVIACDGRGEPKPSAEPYQRALDMLGLEPAQAIAYEDSPTGCAAARAAGLFVVGISIAGADLGAHEHCAEVPGLTPEEIVAAHRGFGNGS